MLSGAYGDEGGSNPKCQKEVDNEENFCSLIKVAKFDYISWFEKSFVLSPSVFYSLGLK